MIFHSTLRRQIEWPPKTCLELGAGAALPSLALLHEGAHRVILTDSARANSRTFDTLHKSVHANAKVWNISEEELSHRVKIVPHTWGEVLDELSSALGGSDNNSADLVIASDCIYNPTHHTSLLQSAVRSMSSDGLFIVGYSLHGNVPSDRVLNFFNIAKHEFGLEIVNQVMREYDCQVGIGSNDRNRAVVYVKVLARQLNSPSMASDALSETTSCDPFSCAGTISPMK
jgi:predicted nicotinamide N-methyase